MIEHFYPYRPPLHVSVSHAKIRVKEHLVHTVYIKHRIIRVNVFIMK